MDDNIKLDLREIVRGAINFSHVTQNKEQRKAPVNTVINDHHHHHYHWHDSPL